MISVTPVIPGHPEIKETSVGKGQEEVSELHSVIIPGPQGEVITRWEFDTVEWEMLSQGSGHLFLEILTFGDKVQPVRLYVASSDEVYNTERVFYKPEELNKIIQKRMQIAVSPIQQTEEQEETSLTVRTVPQKPFTHHSGVEVVFARYPDGMLELFPRGDAVGKTPAGYSDEEVVVKALVRGNGEKFLVAIPTTRKFLDTEGAENFLANAALGWGRL